MMKKGLCLVLAVLLVLCVFAGCAGTQTGTDGSEILQPEEFGIYEDRKLLAMPEEFEGGSVFFELAMQYDYNGRELSTKRGIQIGSTARELAEAYKGCDFWIPQDGGSATVSAMEYIENFQEYDEGTVVVSTYEVDGQLYDKQGWEEWAESQGGAEALFESGKYQVTQYAINFMMDGNIVNNIFIRYNPNILASLFT